MRSSLRPSLLLFLAWSCASVQADEIQVLPPIAVTVKAGQTVGQPTLLNLPAGSDTTLELADLARRAAGFSINDAGARGFGATSTLRGLSNTPYFGDSSAPVYLDDIPLVSPFAFPTELYDFQQVALYRGPQAAALFGRAGDAGVIQFLSAPATAQTISQARFSVGNYGLFSLGASVQGTTSSAADISAGVGFRQRDGYIQNTQLNRTVDDRESLSARMRVNYRPAAGTELSLQLIGQRARDGAQALLPLGGPLDQVARGKEGVSDTDFAAAALSISRRLPEGTLSATSSWSTWQMDPYSNRLVVFGGANFDSVINQQQQSLAEELRYVGERFSAGAFWSDARTTGGAYRVFSGFPIERSNFQTDADQLAVYGRGTLALGAGWTLAPGLRAEHTAKQFTRHESIPANTRLYRSESWSALLPSVTATRHLDEMTDLTISLARGFKAGGYSAYTGRADLAAFAPQRSWSLEAAYHTAPRGANFSNTVRAYATRVTGYQIERSFAVPNSYSDEYLVVNAGEARVLGLELESGWQASRDIAVTLTAALTQAKLQRFTDPFTGSDYSGKQAPYAPAGNGALRVDYRPAKGFFAGAGLSWTGTTYYDEQESAAFAQRSYWLVEADAGFAFAQGQIRIFGRNLGDKAYYSSITPGVGHATPGAPLTFGTELALHW